jgi:hypothetical protein
MGMLQNATDFIFSTEFKIMETDQSSTVQQVQEMRQVLQRTILLAIRNFEESSGCHVEGVELTSTLAMVSRVYGVECRVVL